MKQKKSEPEQNAEVLPEITGKQMECILHKAGISKRAFAEFLGVREQTVRNWVNQDKLLPGQVQKIYDFFNMTGNMVLLNTCFKQCGVK